MHGFLEMFDNTCSNKPYKTLTSENAHRPEDAFDRFRVAVRFVKEDGIHTVGIHETPSSLCPLNLFKLGFMKYASSSESIRHKRR